MTIRADAPRVLDVSGLAPGAFGHRGLLWWGTAGFIVIEGTMFAIAVAAYFYLRLRSTTWPPNLPPPALLWGTVNVAITLASVVPNALARRAAEQIDLRGVRLWLLVCVGCGVAFNIVRALEFGALNCRWDSNAYGSIVWMLMGLHTVHIVTDLLDTGVLTALMFIGPVEEKRFIDVVENCVYWYFVVGSWVLIYGVVYWAPRLT